MDAPAVNRGGSFRVAPGIRNFRRVQVVLIILCVKTTPTQIERHPGPSNAESGRRHSVTALWVIVRRAAW
jgi:hypothetical protein